MRDYIHVSDLAAAHVLALEALIAEPARSLTMNCGYGRGFSVLEVLDAVDRVTNLTIERRLEGRRVGDPPSLISDNARIMATLAVGAAIRRSRHHCRTCLAVGAQARRYPPARLTSLTLARNGAA